MFNNLSMLNSENWNATLLAFADHLVQGRAFDEVNIHRLPVGEIRHEYCKF